MNKNDQVSTAPSATVTASPAAAPLATAVSATVTAMAPSAAAGAPPAAPARQRLKLHDGADGIAVWFDPATNPGVRAFGNLKPGVEYIVAPAEAHRLVTVKRFALVNAADAARLEAAAPAPVAPEPSAAPANPTPTE